MTKIGYARVSTHSQDLSPQLSALEGAGCEKLFKETASGSKADREKFLAMLQYARPGDTIVVWRLDRLARSLKDLISTVTHLNAQDISLISITEAIDTTTPSGKLVFHIFGAIAEFERNLIRERTQNALAAARKNGRVGGRPRALNPAAIKKAHTWLADKKMTKSEVARALGVSLSTLSRELKRNAKAKA